MFMVEMMKKVSVVRMLVQMSGMVIWKNWRTRPAPSMDELSYMSRGTAAMDAMYMTM